MRVYDKVEYKKYIENLSGEYKDCYDKIEGYIKVCFSGNNESEEKCIYQILGELISAQKSLKPLSMVIGNNLKEYCDKYIKLNQSSNSKHIKSLQTTAIYGTLILILMIIKSIKLYSGDFANNLSFGVLEVVALIYALLWNVLRLNIVKFAIKNNKMIKNLDLYLNIIFILFLFPLINITDKLMNFEIKIPLFLFVAFIAIIILIFAYTIKYGKDEVKTE